MTTYVINPITNELESAQPRQRVAEKFKLEDMLTPGPLKDELQGDFDPTQETYEEYLQRKRLGDVLDYIDKDQGQLIFDLQLVLVRDDENDQGDGEGEKLMQASEAVQYPDNVTFKNIGIFILMPTLVYQTSYPRTERIRKRWLLKRFLELGVCIALMLVSHFQFVRPTLENAKDAIRNKNVMKLLERLLIFGVREKLK